MSKDVRFYSVSRVLFKLTSFLALFAVLASCVGESYVPIIYHEPNSQGEYVVNTFKPKLEFPNGLPDRDDVIITINGADVSSEFDDWGDSFSGDADPNVVEITQAINSLNTPIFYAALRDGRNIFQVTKPAKSYFYFYMDMPGATIHITQVDDQWDGDMNTPKSGSIAVEGYLDQGDYSALSQIRIKTFAIDYDGSFVANSGDGTDMSAAPDGVEQVYGDFSLTFNPDYTFSFIAYDGGNNDGLYDMEDADLIGITVSDQFGSYTKNYLRSNIPLSNQRIANGGALSLAFDQVALKSLGNGLADAINQIEDTIILEDIVLAEDVCFGLSLGDACLGLEQDITASVYLMDMYFENSAVTLETPVQDNIETGDIWVDAFVPIRLGPGSRVEVQDGLIECSLNNSNIEYASNIIFSVDDSEITTITMDNDSLDLGGLIGGNPLCQIVEVAVSDLFSGMVVDAIGDIVETVFNVDLPLLRLVIRIGPEDDLLFGPAFLTLNPVASHFFGVQNSWDNSGSPGDESYNVKWGMSLGFHSLGQGVNRIPSLGSKYEAATLTVPGMSVDNTEMNDRTVGMVLSENFINQLLMGLWESGILYLEQAIQFDGGIVPLNAFLSDITFAFASASPWEIDLLPDNDPKGDMHLFIPDLRVSLTGTRHFPKPVIEDYNFAFMVADLNVYLDLSSPEGSDALRVSTVSNLEVSVRELGTDWQFLNQSQLSNIFDLVFSQVVGTGQFDIPFPELLGAQMDFGDIWTDEGRLNITIDVYNPEVFCNGPDQLPEGCL